MRVSLTEAWVRASRSSPASPKAWPIRSKRSSCAAACELAAARFSPAGFRLDSARGAALVAEATLDAVLDLAAGLRAGFFEGPDTLPGEDAVDDRLDGMGGSPTDQAIIR